MKNKISIFVFTAIFCTLFAGNHLTNPAMADGGNSTNSTNNNANNSTLHSITMAVTTSLAIVNMGGHTTLTVTITDNTTSPTYPTGTILWTDGTSHGTFLPSSCTLSSGVCTTSYTPSNSTNSVTVTASYTGDSTHHGGTASSLLTTNVIRSTTTSVTPSPATVSTGSTVSFVAKVADTTSMPITPNSTISWTDGTSHGTFTPASCTLLSGTCSTSYAPASSPPTSVTITATYTGDGIHSGSAGISSLAVNLLHGTTTTITKNVVTQSSGSISFVVIVNDTSNSETTPTGTLSWNDGNAAGTFNATSCTLSSGVCVFSYTENANAPNIVTINATYTGDGTHVSSSDVLQLSTNMLDTTTTVVTPNPASFVSRNATTFTATVSDTTNSSAHLIGIVSWNDNGAGGTFNEDACILSANHCSLAYTPHTNPSSSITITASYAGDSTHSASSGTSTLSENSPTTPSSASTPPTNQTATTPATPPVPEPTPQGIVSETQQVITSINEAKNNETIAAQVNIVNQTVQTTSIDNNITVQTNNTSPDTLSVTVSATNETGPKVFLINLEDNAINAANLKYLGIMYDGQPIAPATDVNSILHAKSTDNPSFAIIVTQSGAQILVLVPHFSTHTITITNMSKVIPAVPEFPFAVPILLISITSLIVFYRIKFRLWT